jgi:hypothetical protein
MILVLASAPFVLQNELRPLMLQGNLFDRTREELYFAERGAPALLPSYKAAADFTKRSGCKDIGLDVARDSFEYPLLGLLDGGYKTYSVRHIPAQQLVSRVANTMQGFTPCLVICLGCANRPDAWQEHAREGMAGSVFGDLVVFSRSGTTQISAPSGSY